MEISANTTEFFIFFNIYLSPTLHVRVTISVAVVYKSYRNFVWLRSKRNDEQNPSLLRMLCLLFGVSGASFYFPRLGSDCFDGVTIQSVAPWLFPVWQIQYVVCSTPFIPPNTHSLFLEKQLSEKSLGLSSFQKNKFVRRENSSVMAIKCNILDTV